MESNNSINKNNKNMLKEVWNKIVKFVKHLFAKKATCVYVCELVKRIEALEAVNQLRTENWEAKKKKRNYIKK